MERIQEVLSQQEVSKFQNDKFLKHPEDSSERRTNVTKHFLWTRKTQATHLWLKGWQCPVGTATIVNSIPIVNSKPQQ